MGMLYLVVKTMTTITHGFPLTCVHANVVTVRSRWICAPLAVWSRINGSFSPWLLERVSVTGVHTLALRCRWMRMANEVSLIPARRAVVSCF